MRHFQIPGARTDLFATAACITSLQRPGHHGLLQTRICSNGGVNLASAAMSLTGHES